jgi:hypothetical protein
MFFLNLRAFNNYFIIALCILNTLARSSSATTRFYNNAAATKENHKCKVTAHRQKELIKEASQLQTTAMGYTKMEISFTNPQIAFLSGEKLQ